MWLSTFSFSLCLFDSFEFRVSRFSNLSFIFPLQNIGKHTYFLYLISSFWHSNDVMYVKVLYKL